MNKRYQVFVSSTYSDLLEERQAVFQVLMTMPCIPAGMEWFPAETEEQWNVIKKVIDDCDFYVLIVGGRYGSTTPEGLSYTEREFDYAVNKMPVLVFCHRDPLSIPLAKSDVDPELRGRLEAFRKKAMTNRMVNFWENPDRLAAQVALAVYKAILTHPAAIGWVRSDALILKSDLAQPTAENQALKNEKNQVKNLEELVSCLKENLDQVLSNVSDGIMLFTRDARVVLVSRSMESLLDLSRDRLLGAELHHIFDRKSRLGRTVRQAFDAGISIAQKEITTEAGRRLELWLDFIHDDRSGDRLLGALLTLDEPEA